MTAMKADFFERGDVRHCCQQLNTFITGQIWGFQATYFPWTFHERHSGLQGLQAHLNITPKLELSSHPTQCFVHQNSRLQVSWRRVLKDLLHDTSKACPQGKLRILPKGTCWWTPPPPSTGLASLLPSPAMSQYLSDCLPSLLETQPWLIWNEMDSAAASIFVKLQEPEDPLYST